MDDNVSIKSSDSLTTSGEYEIVSDTPPMMIMDTIRQQQQTIIKKDSKSPTLDIANNGDFLDLKKDMTEVIKELDKDKPDSLDTSCEYDMIPETVIDLQSSSTSLPLLSLELMMNDNNNDDCCLSDSQRLQLMDAIQDYNIINDAAKSPKHLTLPLPSSSSSIIASAQQQQTSSSTGLLLLSSSSNKTSTHSDLLSPKSDFSTPDINKVGHSVFYDCIDLSPVTGDIEKHDDMKPEKSSDTEEEISDIDQGCTIFSGVTYLGATNINSPKCEAEIQKNIAELNNGTNSAGLKVSVSIPTNYEGYVVLYDAEKENESVTFATYEVQRILFYARGPSGSNEQACFAFTWSHGDSQESTVFQCHVFRCSIPEAVNQVSSCFQKAFQRFPNSLTGSVTSAADNNSVMVGSVTSDISGNPLSSAGYEFIVSLEIREKVAKSSYSAVPRDRSCFKLRCNTDKEVCITVKQTPSTILQPLYIERCFGILLSPGKLVRQADMQLLDMVSMGYQKMTETQHQQQQQPQQMSQSLSPYQIRAEWKASDKAFEQLNYESQKMFLTVAVDLVIKGIQEPVRFVIETPVTIQSQSEIRIMDHFLSKRSMSLRFYLQLKKAEDGNWEVNSIDPSEEIVEQPIQSSILKFGINNLSKMVRSSSTVSMMEDECPTDHSSDGDEPLLSGTGEVSKDCPQDTLNEWDPVLKEWTDSEKRPKNLAALVRVGIPEALRGKVWQKLANVDNKVDMTDRYRTLITKETKCETVILRDIHRTFPAHKYFKESGGSGQDALFKVSKAYAVYDNEVGYCQGLSFIAASLLLHMPEEDAFCVLVALMYDYGLRDLYKHGFETLYMRLSQLNRLIKEHLPKLYEHFEKTGVETHMFASQWFLTLFTARFPLYFVFYVLDVFLLDGMQILFQVAISLLAFCENDLKQHDFEGILKYFRVILPKKCRSAVQARKIMKSACERKMKRLKQYEDEFLAKKNAERIEKENQTYELRFNEERKKFYIEIQNLQQLLEQANEKIQQEDKKHTNIVQDYKHIIQRQEQQITKLNDMLEEIMKTMSTCQTCSSSIESNSPLHDTFGKQLKSTTNNQSLMNDKNLDPLDPLSIALQRIRELELELAQTKLAQVEAECKNQDLNHQLNTTLTEIQSNRSGSWQPWLSKTINSIQEKVTTSRKDTPPAATFQSYMNPLPDQNDQKSRELSPKMQNRNRLNRNSVDLIQKNEHHQHPVLREAFSFNSMK